MVRMTQKHFLEGQVYSVPLIQPDLRREEVVHQIADALFYLETISTDIFRRVSESVEKNRHQLQSVTDRIRLAQARVDKIKGSKKATKVFSSAKYPAPDRLQDYTSIFTEATDPSSQTRPRRRIQNKLRPFDEKTLQEKLMYYPVCVSNKKKSEDETEEGLGSLPRNISSVSSLLLFNTTENLYKKYVFLDPLAGAVTKTHTTLETEKEEKPFDAPLSITKREQLERQTAESYFYVPDLGEVPEIDVPSYLPDLPGIADDLSYSADLGPGFAPSGPTHNIPELPSFSEEGNLPGAQVQPNASFPASPPPPPPPPPPPNLPLFLLLLPEFPLLHLLRHLLLQLKQTYLDPHLQVLFLVHPTRWFSRQTAVPVCWSLSAMLEALAKPSYAMLKNAKWRRRSKRSKSKQWERHLVVETLCLIFLINLLCEGKAFLGRVQRVGSRVKLLLVLVELLPGCQMSSHLFLPHSRQQMTTTGKHNLPIIFKHR
ncbi:hypothetical protein Q5P01_012414 [Channa striata]|uniref:WASH1 WAHD domain-containing protein n=1 Tax=Channa striata TaxID=64152 RepID=A0AA88SR45_CHASR|nr:hypothetical protein Q5P01_012414 [Channa striata]